MKNKNTRRGFTQINWVGQALPDNAPAKGHLAAFTLIELLVVVLIIGILAAVAVPQYQKAVEKSKATQALTLLKSISQAAEEFYLANGREFASWDELAMDFPSFTGNTKANPAIPAQTTKSNGEWSLQLLNEQNDGWTIAYMYRINGKYKGGGFFITLFSRTSKRHANLKIGCTELITGTYAFDTSLKEGAFCHDIMNGTLIDTDATQRAYSLP